MKCANEKKNIGKGSGDGNIYHIKAKRLVLVLHYYLGEEMEVQRDEVSCREPHGL